MIVSLRDGEGNRVLINTAHIMMVSGAREQATNGRPGALLLGKCMIVMPGMQVLIDKSIEDMERIISGGKTDGEYMADLLAARPDLKNAD